MILFDLNTLGTAACPLQFSNPLQPSSRETAAPPETTASSLSSDLHPQPTVASASHPLTAN